MCEVLHRSLRPLDRIRGAGAMSEVLVRRLGHLRKVHRICRGGGSPDVRADRTTRSARHSHVPCVLGCVGALHRNVWPFSIWFAGWRPVLQRITSRYLTSNELISEAMTAVPGAVELLPLPPSGRRFTAERKVRLSDASPGGRLRLDAVARFLHDVANDDARDVELPDAMYWIVRRTKIHVSRPVMIHENVKITTWCSGHGGRWAERRTQLAGDGGGLIDAVSVWVSVDGETGAPKRLDDTFFETWGESAAGRVVRARLMHPRPADHLGSSWPIRYSDLDVVGHVNNAIYWTAVEAAMAENRSRGRVTAEMEFAAGIGPRTAVTLISETHDTTHRLWFTVDDAVVASGCFVVNS